MSDHRDNLERLTSLHLDDEITTAQRRELNALLRNDPAADACFEESCDLDREVNYALRAALGRSTLRRRTLPLWSRVGRAVGLAVAACIALLMWLAPPERSERARPGQPTQASSWFAPPPSWGDTLVESPAAAQRPGIRLDDSSRNWVVIPGEKPGEFLIVEIRRTKTCTIRIQQDF